MSERRDREYSVRTVLQVTCPWCKAAPREPCRPRGSRVVMRGRVHQARRDRFVQLLEAEQIRHHRLPLEEFTDPMPELRGMEDVPDAEGRFGDPSF